MIVDEGTDQVNYWGAKWLVIHREPMNKLNLIGEQLISVIRGGSNIQRNHELLLLHARAYSKMPDFIALESPINASLMVIKCQR